MIELTKDEKEKLDIWTNRPDLHGGGTYKIPADEMGRPIFPDDPRYEPAVRKGDDRQEAQAEARSERNEREQAADIFRGQGFDVGRDAAGQVVLPTDEDYANFVDSKGRFKEKGDQIISEWSKAIKTTFVHMPAEPDPTEDSGGGGGMWSGYYWYRGRCYWPHGGTPGSVFTISGAYYAINLKSGAVKWADSVVGLSDSELNDWEYFCVATKTGTEYALNSRTSGDIRVARD